VPIDLEWVPYGRPAAEALRSVIATAKAADPLIPVTVVVPSNHVGVAARRLLASGALGPASSRGSGLAAVTFLTVYRLAELLGAARLAGRGRRPVSTPVIAAALRRALTADPGIFAPVAHHPSTEMALVSAYRELRDLSAEALAQVSSQSARAADVVRLHHAARMQLEHAFYDEEDLVDAARETLSTDGSAGRDLGTVVVYLPQRLSLHGAALLAAVGEHAEVRVLAGTTGDPGADAVVRSAVKRLQPAPALQAPGTSPAGRGRERATSEPPRIDAMAVVSPERMRIVTASDSDDEVRIAVRAVVDAVRQGTPLERIAILYGAHEPYARLVHEQLAAAGIPHNGTSVVALSSRLAARTLLGLLALGKTDFCRADVFAWLSACRLHYHGRPVPVGTWERVSRDAGVIAGRAQWDQRLARYADEREANAQRAEADPDAPEWRASSFREIAGRARMLRAFVLELIDDLAEADRAPRDWAEHASWARRRLSELCGPDDLRARWPLVEQKAAERTLRALDRLACLTTVEGPVSLEVFTRTLIAELEADLGRVGRMGEGLLVGSLRMGVGLDLDLVIVLGLAEGLLPAPVHEDSLLPDDERKAAGGELALRSEEMDRQRHELLATLAGARHQLLGVPRGDLRQANQRVPSRWVTAIASALAGTHLAGCDLVQGRTDGEAPRWLGHVASFDAGLREVSFPADEQEWRLRAMLASASLPADPSHDRKKFDDEVLDAGIAAVMARRSARFTRFDGRVTGLAVPSPLATPTSATRLERWATCPFAFFVKELLGIEPVENPEDRLQISPLDFGSLIHEVLERFLEEVLARPPSAQPGPDDAWTEGDRRRLLEIAEMVCDHYEANGLVGRPIFWRRDRRRIMADLTGFLDADSAHRASTRARPVAAELAFGLSGGNLEAVAFELDDGRHLRFRGKADRLDVTADGTLEVIDYKTGRADRYRGLSEDDPDLGGTRLQLAVYALAARLHQGAPQAPVRSSYWFATNRENFTRIGYTVSPTVLERVASTLSRMVRGIERGVFPPNPTAVSTSPWVDCPYCDPDGLGVADLRRQIERKRDDPELSVFFDLTEGRVSDHGR